MWRDCGFLVLASVLVFFLGLGRGAIGDSDEAFYAEAAREMVESGDWVTPHYNYEDRFQKPILYYWLAAGAYVVNGPTEAAARFPSACAGLALVLLTWACARRYYDGRTGLLAGLIVSSNFGYFALGRLALPDLPLAALMTLATWAALEAARLSDPRPAGSARAAGDGIGWLLLSAAAAALAMLMKGPVGVALPVVTVLVATRAGLAGKPRWLPVAPTRIAAAGVLFLLVAVPWYAAMVQEHGLGYLQRFFVAENVERFATDRYNEPRSLLFYGPIVLGGLAPWSAFFLLWLPRVGATLRSRRLALSRPALTMVVWAAVPLLFYSLSIGKQPRYVLPVLPPLAMLLARSLTSRLGASRGRASNARLIGWSGSVAAALLVTAGGLLARTASLFAALTPGSVQMAATLVVAAGAVVAIAAWRLPRAMPTVLAAASIATLLLVHYSVFSGRDAEPVQRMAAAHRAAHRAGDPSATHRVFVRNLVFYTGVRQTDLNTIPELAEFLAQPRRVLCVLRQRDLEQLERAHQVRPRVLHSLGYFNPAALRLKTMLWPDPSQVSETVHLVTNQ